MGQGNYVAIVYGTLDMPDFDADTYDGPYKIIPDSAYEARQRWVGYRVAANGGMAERGELELERFAVPLFRLAAHIEATAPKSLAEARRKWDAWREKHPEFPPGELLFVADYD